MFINSWKVLYCFEVVIMYCHLPIFIDGSVGIEILILKYKGEGEEGWGLLETFVMKINELVVDLHQCKCSHQNPHYEVQRWRIRRVWHFRNICYAYQGVGNCIVECKTLPRSWLQTVKFSLHTFGGPKVLFVGRCDLGGSPHKELTSWRKSLNFSHHGEKSSTFHIMEKNSLKC